MFEKLSIAVIGIDDPISCAEQPVTGKSARYYTHYGLWCKDIMGDPVRQPVI